MSFNLTSEKFNLQVPKQKQTSIWFSVCAAVKKKTLNIFQIKFNTDNKTI